MAEAKTGETIAVGCKLPNGIELRVFRKEMVSEPVMGGGVREVPLAVEIGRIKLKGWWNNFGRHKPKEAVEAAYAVTTGVDKALFEKWRSDNKDSELVRNNIVIAHQSDEVVRKKTDEMNSSVPSGAEPLDPSMQQKDGMAFAKDPRFPRGPRGQSLIEEGTRSP
jgi:hypothetical protein